MRKVKIKFIRQFNSDLEVVGTIVSEDDCKWRVKYMHPNFGQTETYFSKDNKHVEVVK